MPFCDVVNEQTGPETTLNNAVVKIFYRTYGHGPTKALLIIGLAGTHESWGPQIKGLTGADKPNDDDDEDDDEEDGSRIGEGVEVCAFDNRGMGRSSVPTQKSEYTTMIMAKDSISLLDHLGWERAHIIGHSMGAMVACKVAAMAPERVLSLALLNVTGGGFECFPKLDRLTLSIAIRFWMAKTPRQRAAVDLDTHYSQDYLEERVGTDTRRDVLYQAMPEAGVSSAYSEVVENSGLQKRNINNLMLVGYIKSQNQRLNGSARLDFLSQLFMEGIRRRPNKTQNRPICYARRLAQRLYPIARMVDLHGGHLVSHERTEEVNKSLHELIKASEMKKTPNDWTNLDMENPGYFQRRIALIRSSSEGKNAVSSSSYIILEKFHRCLLFLFGLLVMVFEYARRAFRVVKPVKVGPSLT